MTRKLVLMLTIVLLVVSSLPLMAAGPDGAALYKSKCAMCHGPDGAGQTPTGKSMKIRDLRSADVQKATDADLDKIITDGKGKMPAYKGKLSAAEITAIVQYIRSIKK